MRGSSFAILGVLSRLLQLEFAVAVVARLLGTAQKGEGSPYEDYEEASEEGEDARQQETPPFSLLHAFLIGYIEDGHVFGCHRYTALSFSTTKVAAAPL